MEVLYQVWKDENEQDGRLAYQQCLSLPIEWMHEQETLLQKAAQTKARYPLSLADAWIAAAAMLLGAALAHKDSEFAALDCAQLVLPYK